MSVKAISWALDHVTGLTATQKCILISIADRCNQDNECWPSYDDICRRTGADRHTVSRALKKFVAMGIVEKAKRFSKSTVYKLLISEQMHTAISEQMHTATSADIPTLTVNEPSKEPNAQKDDGFEEFWGAYPRKVARAKAESAWRNIGKKDQKAAINSLSSWPFSDDKKFVPYPATWINQRRWEDADETESNEGFVL